MKPPKTCAATGAALLIAASLLSACTAVAPTPAPPTAAARPAPPPGCPAAADELPVQALYGTWTARFDGMPGIATVTFRPHPDYAGGVRGTIVRDGVGAQLAGDIADDGLLTLDESRDGRSISAVWSGDMQTPSCGKEFKGTWRNATDNSTRSFVLDKTGRLP